ncbi:MAG: hypothetical protein WBP56_17780 [Polyangia bacterium]
MNPDSSLKFDRTAVSVILLVGSVVPSSISIAAELNTHLPARFVLDMVHNNPGESPQPSSFRDPRKLAEWGYNGQVLLAEAEACETFDALAPDILPKNGDARLWIEEHAQKLEKLAARAHAAGIKAYAWMQFSVLPKALVAHFRNEICDGQGRIVVERPMTQKILRAQVAELFDRCPSWT